MDTGINMLGQFEGESSDFQQQQSQTSIGFADIQGTETNDRKTDTRCYPPVVRPMKFDTWNGFEQKHVQNDAQFEEMTEIFLEEYQMTYPVQIDDVAEKFREFSVAF